jgi:hypothetical protein
VAYHRRVSLIVSFAADLKQKHAKARAKLDKLRASMAAAEKDFDELDTALNVLTKHGYIEDEAHPAAGIGAAVATNETHMYLLKFVPEGEIGAIAPKEVADIVRSTGRNDLDPDYIRTVLWRLAQRGILMNKDGRYWRPKKDEAPDAEASEASNSMGPVGREGGYPPSTPEGSIPSGSTPVQAADEGDLDDDVPF